MEDPNELVIVSEAVPEGGQRIELGVWRNRRVIARDAGTHRSYTP